MPSHAVSRSCVIHTTATTAPECRRVCLVNCLVGTSTRSPDACGMPMTPGSARAAISRQKRAMNATNATLVARSSRCVSDSERVDESVREEDSAEAAHASPAAAR